MGKRFAHRPFVTANAKTADLPHDWYSHGYLGISTDDPVRANKWRAMAAARGLKVHETDDAQRAAWAAQTRRNRAKFANAKGSRPQAPAAERQLHLDQMAARQEADAERKQRLARREAQADAALRREAARRETEAWEAAEAAAAGWASAPPAAEPDTTSSPYEPLEAWETE